MNYQSKDFSSKELVIESLISSFKYYFQKRSSLNWSDSFISDILKPEKIFLQLGTTDKPFQRIAHRFYYSLFDWNDLRQLRLYNLPENHLYLPYNITSELAFPNLFIRNECPEILLPLYEQVTLNGFSDFGPKKSPKPKQLKPKILEPIKTVPKDPPKPVKIDPLENIEFESLPLEERIGIIMKKHGY